MTKKISSPAPWMIDLCIGEIMKKGHIKGNAPDEISTSESFCYIIRHVI